MDYNKTINILGVKISLENKKQVIKTINASLADNRQLFITTPNPEILLIANKDKEYKDILNKSDIAIADGFGLKLAGLTYLKNIPRITGADLLIDILQIAKNNQYKILILNWKKSLSTVNNIKHTLSQKFLNLQFKILESGQELNTESLDKIKEFSPKIIILTMGAPYQEKIIYNNLKFLPSVNLAIGVGGAFDFFTGNIKRAPKIFQVSGLEWLYRIFQEKGKRRLWRLKRIYRATIVFSYKFLIWRII